MLIKIIIYYLEKCLPIDLSTYHRVNRRVTSKKQWEYTAEGRKKAKEYAKNNLMDKAKRLAEGAARKKGYRIDWEDENCNL